ncbi:hypothetical protein SAMN05192562_11250 [Kosakonia arachidis]|uniref:Uncharacterized protein n=1 Tax=Kosakonia arachidis TaxID=551989 RepID=A0A1I7E8L9_9ENTR|nr:hypothetical protein [Kosakonia arachidis]SFU20281.1 hypothetical protein SAMN05192562_11250 [Kosakonia arachidis]
MAKPLLRSGKLDDLQALGENVQMIFMSTLRLRRQQNLFNCLAIPQRYEDDNRMNGYAPLESKVIVWSAASETEQHSALCHLGDCQTALLKRTQRENASDASRLIWAISSAGTHHASLRQLGARVQHIMTRAEEG